MKTLEADALQMSPETRTGQHETVPLAFGAERNLFGILTLPGGPPKGSLGVVICGPLGHQNICSYRPLRTLAQRIADRGLPVLRFDWLGCGDSADPPASIEGRSVWRDAAHEAVEQIRTATGVDEVALVGLRIGATLGLLEAAANPAVTQAVLLAPYVTGRSYLRELRAFEALAEQSVFSEPETPPPPLPEGSLEAGGFLIAAAERQALESIDLDDAALWSNIPGRALIIATHEERSTAVLTERLAGAGSEVSTHVEPALAHVWDSSQLSFMPPECSRVVADWLADGIRHPAPRELPVVTSPGPLLLAGGEVREDAHVLETERGRLFGVTCLPARADATSDDWVVFLNTGRVRRAGTNRLSTVWARKWAQADVPSLRLDVHGVGDSDGDSMCDEIWTDDPSLPYRPELQIDVQNALNWLAEQHHARRFTLVGLCSGGTLAFQMARIDPRVVGVGMINPPAFFWDDRLQFLRAWDDAVAGGSNPISIVTSIHTRGRRWAKKALRGSLLTLRGQTPETWHRQEIFESLRRLQEANVGVATVFSARDRGIRYLERAITGDYRPQLEEHGVMFEMIKGPDHTFRPLWSHPMLQSFFEGLLRSVGFLHEPPDSPALDPDGQTV